MGYLPKPYNWSNYVYPSFFRRLFSPNPTTQSIRGNIFSEIVQIKNLKYHKNINCASQAKNL